MIVKARRKEQRAPLQILLLLLLLLLIDLLLPDKIVNAYKKNENDRE